MAERNFELQETYLTEISTIIKCLFSLLDKDTKKATIQTKSSWHEKHRVPLLLPDHNFSQFALLLPGCLTVNARQEIENIFRTQYNRIRLAHQDHWNDLFEQFASSDVQEGFDAKPLSLAFERNFERSIKVLANAIIANVTNAIDKYRNFSQRNNCLSKPKVHNDSEERGENVSRSHPKLAIYILEKAYGYTANISRAEKIKLANITNLEPRQVTIWVSIPLCTRTLGLTRFDCSIVSKQTKS